jgi:hypothetical protein
MHGRFRCEQATWGGDDMSEEGPLLKPSSEVAKRAAKQAIQHKKASRLELPAERRSAPLGEDRLCTLMRKGVYEQLDFPWRCSQQRSQRAAVGGAAVGTAKQTAARGVNTRSIPRCIDVTEVSRARGFGQLDRAGKQMGFLAHPHSTRPPWHPRCFVVCFGFHHDQEN